VISPEIGGGHVANVWWRLTDLEVVSGSGCIVTSADGQAYLDFTSGIGVTNTGHCHPAVVAAIRAQAGRFLHAQVNIYRHPLLEALAARLAEVAPPSIEQFFFANSGAEAIEAAVKLARYATRRPNLIVFHGGFHGRTAMTMAMSSSKALHRTGYAPLPAGVIPAPYPYWFRTGEEPEAASARCLNEISRILKSESAPEETAAIVVEPILGEGGYVVPPTAFLAGLQEICRERGILLVFDEIQSGFGRTGKFFAGEHFGVAPDILVMAKGMGSGFPISAIGASSKLMSRWTSGSHGGTYGGNPLGCAAAIATLDVIKKEGLLEKAVGRGVQLRAGLLEIQDRDSGVGDVRGLGLMVGVELVKADATPDDVRTQAIIRRCREDSRLLLLDCGTSSNVIRIIPPLVVSEDQVDVALEAIDKAFRSTVRTPVN
jgi:4-aminobutyrate aminotransferase